MGRASEVSESQHVVLDEAGERVGERVGAIVVPRTEALDALRGKDGLPLAESAVAALLRDEVRRLGAGLADYKRPRRVQIRAEEFEKTSTGKIQKFKLREMAKGV